MSQTQQDAALELSQDISHITISGSGRNFVGTNTTNNTTIVQAPVERPETPPAPSNGVPFRRDADFVERGDLLDRVETKCASEASRVALVGIGGAGKSQLAIEYCHRLHQRSPTTWIFWIHASSIERIEQGFRAIAEEAKIAGRKDVQNNIFELVARWLRYEKKGPWLLVLDNVDDDTVLLAPAASTSQAKSEKESGRWKNSLSVYLPQCAHGSLLVTSRARSVATKLVEPRDMLMVEPMTSKDAVTLLRKKLEITDMQGDLEELAGVLEYMPLAIVQAAAYIQRQGPEYHMRRYIEDFQRSDDRKTSLLNYEAGHLRRDSEAKNSVITAWQISFDHIREQWPSAAHLLALMSFFDRQSIPQEVLDPQISEDESRGHKWKRWVRKIFPRPEHMNVIDYFPNPNFEEDIEHLRNYSFVSTGVDNKTFQMHGLVQLATRKWLAMHGESEWWGYVFISNLATVMPDGSFENWDQCERLLPHVRMAEEQQPESNECLWAWYGLSLHAGWYALERGRYCEAEKLFGMAARASTKASGKPDIYTATAISRLGCVYSKQRRWTEAEKLAIEAVEIEQQILGKNHTLTLHCMTNLALAHADQGQWDEAEKLAADVLKRRKRVFGEDHLETLSVMGVLAYIYWNQDRDREAEKLAREVTEKRRRILGKEHPDTLSSRIALSVYQRGEQSAEAEKLLLETLEVQKRVRGDEHPETLLTLDNLAVYHQEQGRWEEAEQLGRKVLEIRKRVLGEEHLDTISSTDKLAAIMKNRGKDEEAVGLMLECVELLSRVLGPEHPQTLYALEGLNEWREAN